MEPFRITCETCRSRLRVRDAEAIGQIHACPKCGSMVQIVLPAGWNAGTPIPLPDPPAGQTSTPALAISTSASTVVPTEFILDGLVEPAIVTPTSEGPAVAAATPNGISPAIWWAASSAAVLIVAGLSYALWPKGPAPAQQPRNADVKVVAAAPADQSANADPSATAVASALPDVPQAAPVPTESPAEVVATTANSALPEPAPTDSTPRPAENSKHEQVLATASAKSGPPAPPPRPEEAAPPAAALASSERQNPDALTDAAQVLKFDPLDFDPDRISASSLSPVAASVPTPAESTRSITAKATEEAATPADTDRAPDPREVRPAPEVNPPIQVRRGPASPDEVQPVDAARRLAVPLKSLQLTDVPLVRLIDTSGDMAGVPITLDPRALELNGQSPRTIATMNVTETSLDRALNDTLGELRLELADPAGRPTVALVGRSERKAVDFDVTDLAVDGDASAIANLLQQFVAPRSWQTGGGKGTLTVDGGVLHIDQTLAVRREALIFCERLRLARNRPLRSKYPAELLAVDSPYARLIAKLRGQATFTFLPWTRLADLVHELQQLAGITILVDWAALADAGLAPSSSVACSVNERPWGVALDGVLAPLGLAWWAVDDQTLQITSRDALGRIERVEFYLVPKAMSGPSSTSTALIESLRNSIADQANEAGLPIDVRMQVDEPSGRLIVRASPEVHRFLAERIAADAK